MTGDPIIIQNILFERAQPDPSVKWLMICAGVPGAPAKKWMILGEKITEVKGEKGPDGNDAESGGEPDYDGEDGEFYEGEYGEEDDEMDKEL